MPILKKKEPSAEPVTFRYHYSALRAADGWSEEPVWPDWTPALERPHNPTENAKTFTLEMEMGSDDTVFDKAPGTETTEAQKKAKAAKAAETAQATLIALQTKETQRKLAEEQAERARKMQDEASDFKARILERGKSLLLQRQATEISDDAVYISYGYTDQWFNHVFPDIRRLSPVCSTAFPGSSDALTTRRNPTIQQKDPNLCQK